MLWGCSFEREGCRGRKWTAASDPAFRPAADACCPANGSPFAPLLIGGVRHRVRVADPYTLCADRGRSSVGGKLRDRLKNVNGILGPCGYTAGPCAGSPSSPSLHCLRQNASASPSVIPPGSMSRGMGSSPTIPPLMSDPRDIGYLKAGHPCACSLEKVCLMPTIQKWLID